MSILPVHALSGLTVARDFAAARVSSWDTRGRNADYWHIEPGETRVLADLKGAGVISHIWFTINSPDKLYLRKLVLRIYWDGEASPSVEAPVGDFFGLGHARAYSYQCVPFNTSCHGKGNLGGGVAMNCWWQMPFHKSARVEIENQQEEPVRSFYFYIDYQKHQSLSEDTLHFHAQWRRENPCDGWTGEGSYWGSRAWALREQGESGVNLSDEKNYLILEAEGRGHYVGVNFAIDHQARGWWGEGDDMIFIDRDGERAWPPDMHGTGSEDYLAQAWGMQNNAHMYNGQSWAELEDNFNDWGKVCVYRYHIVDPIPFTKNIRVSIEHGHANDRSDDWSSTAYWYQTEPHKVFPPLPSMDLRLPNFL
ncbi:MAG: DUF2961 domain-containing protein [Armatimonadetes bacterium]|nr:DUF2961 domain-containing protein [Armatimonadota bacterium]